MKQTFRLAHAQAGENYSGKLLPINEQEGALSFLDIKLPPGLMLTPNIAEGTLSGLTGEPGEYDIVVEFFRPGTTPLREERGIATLLIIPNPKLMWKNLPSPRNAPYWVPDEKHSLTTAAGFSVTAASKRGRSHAHIGSFRDDDYTIVSDGTWLIAIVADGAGSAKYSRMGARLACHISSHSLLEMLRDDPGGHIEMALKELKATTNTVKIKEAFSLIIQTSLQQVLDEIRFESTTLNDGSEVREFSTTTLITITRKIEDSILIVSYSVGDGAIGIYQKETSLNLLVCGDSGEYAGQTRFLNEDTITTTEVLRRTKVTILPTMSALIMMSDGVSDPFFETDNQLIDVSCWDALWANINAAEPIAGETSDIRLLKWLDFWSKGNHDDRTIIIITQE